MWCNSTKIKCPEKPVFLNCDKLTTKEFIPTKIPPLCVMFLQFTFKSSLCDICGKLSFLRVSEGVGRRRPIWSPTQAPAAVQVLLHTKASDYAKIWMLDVVIAHVEIGGTLFLPDALSLSYANWCWSQIQGHISLKRPMLQDFGLFYFLYGKWQEKQEKNKIEVLFLFWWMLWRHLARRGKIQTPQRPQIKKMPRGWGLWHDDNWASQGWSGNQ